MPGSLRLRLTAVYGGLFLIAGTVLLAITYGLVAQQISRAPAARLPDADRLERLREGLGMGSGLDLESPLQAIREAQQTERANALHELLTQSAVALGITTLIAVVLGWLLAGRALRPLREITATARRLSTHNLDERIDLEGPAGELKDLADTFDGMLARLSAAFEAQRRFAANASHELRTPLTVQRAAIDVALANPTQESLKNMAVRLRAATERHEHVIESLLTLARSQSGVARRQDVDLAAAVEGALAGAETEIRDRGLSVRRSLAPATLLGDAVLVERLAVNLVQNAARHNVDDGWISVETGVTSGGDTRSVTLLVSNSGRQLPQERVAELFQPFRRLAPDRVAPARSGYGGEPRGDSGRGTAGAVTAAAPVSAPTAGPDVSVAREKGETGAGTGSASGVRAAPGHAEGVRVPPESGVAARAGSSSGSPARAAGSAGGAKPPTGVGLGLSIVAAIAAAHGGTCTARAREDGGLEMSVSLPMGSR